MSAIINSTIVISFSPDLDALCCAYIAHKSNDSTVSFGKLIPGTSAEYTFKNIVKYFKNCQEAYEFFKYRDPKLKNLVSYCYQADTVGLSRKESLVGSLKYIVMRLRSKLPGANDILWKVFCRLADADNYGNDLCNYLYQDNTLRKICEPLLASETLDIKNLLEFHEVDKYKVCTFVGDKNITNKVFDLYPEVDVYIFKNHLNDWAGYVLRSKERRPDIDLRSVKKLLDERKENWFLHSSGNILICGGPKFPHDHTSLEIPDLLCQLKQVITKT